MAQKKFISTILLFFFSWLLFGGEGITPVQHPDVRIKIEILPYLYRFNCFGFALKYKNSSDPLRELTVDLWPKVEETWKKKECQRIGVETQMRIIVSIMKEKRLIKRKLTGKLCIKEEGSSLPPGSTIDIRKNNASFVLMPGQKSFTFPCAVYFHVFYARSYFVGRSYFAKFRFWLVNPSQSCSSPSLRKQEGFLLNIFIHGYLHNNFSRLLLR